MKRGISLFVIAALLTLGAYASTGSGLAVGEKIEAFLVKNCEGGDAFCQVCKYGKRPKLISVGDLNDPEWIQDLKSVQALHEKYSKDGKGLAVFGLAATFQGGKAMPVENPEAALAALKKIKEENGLTFPLVIAQNAEQVYKAQGKSNPGYKIFEDYYHVTTSRTMMFGDSSNTVKYSAVVGDRTKQVSEVQALVEKSL